MLDKAVNAGIGLLPARQTARRAKSTKASLTIINDGVTMKKTSAIKETISFKTTPHEVFECLIDSKKHEEFTGDAAEISRKVGGIFSAYGGYCYGQNLELVKDKKIVQTWRATDWPEGHFSTVSFKFTKTKEGTRLSFSQKGIPQSEVKSVKKGWEDFYWKPLKEMLEP